MKRREFLKIGSASVAGGAFVGGLMSDWYGAAASPLPDPRTDGQRVVPTYCELCFWKCGILAHVQDGRVTKIQGNPLDPLSRGRLCPRGAGGTGLLYDPDRLKRPLVRVDRKRGQAFAEVSWEVALDEAADRFDRIRRAHGAAALALFYHGCGGSWMQHLASAIGCANQAAPSYAQCRGPRDAGFELTFGRGVGSPEPTDMAKSRCLVLIGSHLGENMHNSQVRDFAEAIRNRADIIVVDPRFSVAASKARWWLPVRPGSDLALLLAWMNVLIGEGLHDAAYVDAYASGFDVLRAHVRPFTPEWAWPRTGIEPELIRRTARAMAAARPATLVHPGRHVTWYGDDTQRSRAVAMLNALLGSWGREGGLYLPVWWTVPACPRPPYPAAGEARDRARPGDYPFSGEVLAHGLRDRSLPEVTEADRIRGWLVYGTNIPATLPDLKKSRAAIDRLEALVTIDVLPVEVAGWSDVVLPEATYLEREDDLFAPGWRRPFVSKRQAVVPPMYDSRPGWWIARELGQRLGVADAFPWTTIDEYLDTRMKGAGIDAARLARDGVIEGEPAPIYLEEGAAPVFDTPSGKIELHSPQLAAAGFDPMPTWRDGEIEEPPAGYFRLLFGRGPTHTFGRTTNNRLLAGVQKENAVWINDRAARRLGLVDGERVRLRNQDGIESDLSAPLKVTPRIRPDAVYLVHGFGHAAKELRQAHGRGIDDTQLISRYRTDPLMGGTGMNVNFVTVVRSGGAAEAAS